jgi:hypothetical protein
MGAVGTDWQLGGFAVDPPTDNSGDVGPLVQAMAGFGGGAADSSNTALIGADTSQQTLLTTPPTRGRPPKGAIYIPDKYGRRQTTPKCCGSVGSQRTAKRPRTLSVGGWHKHEGRCQTKLQPHVTSGCARIA